MKMLTCIQVRDLLFQQVEVKSLIDNPLIGNNLENMLVEPGWLTTPHKSIKGCRPANQYVSRLDQQSIVDAPLCAIERSRRVCKILDANNGNAVLYPVRGLKRGAIVILAEFAEIR